LCKRQRRGDVEAGEDAVAGDVGVDDGGDPGVLEAAAEVLGRHARGLRPAFDGDAAVLGVDADGDPAGVQPCRLADEVRLAHGRGADDHPGDALGEPALDGAQVADAAPELHRNGDPAQDRLDGGGVHGPAREGAVKVDDVEPPEALALESLGLGCRVVVEDGGLGHVALDEADAAAFLEVDRREQDHGRHRRKFAMSRRPRVWLFSGWNCVPAMLSRPTTAVTAPP
jgi:hypothetical protein